MGANPRTPEAAVGAVCVRHGRLLLVQRARDPGAGLWAVPGGRVERGESVPAAVLRELEEETGLRGRVDGFCGVAERHMDGHHYVIFNHWVRAGVDEAIAGDDAAAVAWASQADLGTLPLVPGLMAFLTAHGVVDRLR